MVPSGWHRMRSSGDGMTDSLGYINEVKPCTILILYFGCPFCLLDPMSSEEIQSACRLSWKRMGHWSALQERRRAALVNRLCWTVAESTIFRRVLRLEDTCWPAMRAALRKSWHPPWHWVRNLRLSNTMNWMHSVAARPNLYTENEA